MRMWIAAGFVTVAALAGAQEDPSVEPLIRKLGSGSPEERAAASKALLDRGQPVRPFLEKATADRDPEIAGRARDLLVTLDRHLDSLGTVLARIRKETGDSHHLLLHRATHAVSDACQGREWDEIAKSLGRQGFTMAHKNEHQGGTTLRYLALKDAYVSPSGVHHDLVLEIETSLQTSKTEPTKTVLRRAKAGFFSESKVEVSEIAAKPYPAGTVLQLLFERPEVRAAGAEYPVLEELRVEYDFIFDRWQELNPWGFRLLARFTNRDRSAGKGVFMTVASGLDPLQTYGGEKALAGFVPKDTLGEFRSWGGSEWKSGNKGEDRRFTTLRSAARERRRPVPPDDRAVLVHGAGDLKALAKDVTSLAVKGDDFTDADCEALIGFAKLRTITTTDAGKITDAGLAHLAKLPDLETLVVSTHRVGDEGIQHLSSLPRLKSLTVFWSSNITDAGVAHLAKAKGLAELDLHWSKRLTDEGLRHLSGLAGLKSLRLWGSGNITDAGLEQVAKLAALEELTLSHSKALTAAGMAHLTKLPSLREISLGYASVNDDGVQALGKIPTLEVIWLHGLEGVTDAGLLQLKTLAKLGELHLDDCKKVTNAGLKALQQALPGKYLLE